MRYYIIAGEASGDLHASNLMRELKKADAKAEFRCWGGDLMQKQGGEIIKHYRDLAFMGFVEVLMNISTILQNIKFCKKDIQRYQPDVLILIDYPGFNLRIAKFAKKAGIKVFYYISPQIWAWKQSRVHQIKKVVDRMFVILPFETDFYKRFDYKTDYVGHPLLDAIEQFRGKKNTFNEFIKNNNLVDKPIIAILPGSRKQEVSKMLEVMLSIIDDYPQYQFVIAGAPSLEKSFYAPFIAHKKVSIVFNKTYSLLQHSEAAMVTSGTATLEAALFEVPEIVCYSGSKISYLIARKLIKVKYISLVNLIMDREVVKELIQDNFNQQTLREELNKILLDSSYRNSLQNEYRQLKEKLGGSGASQKAAALMLKYLVK
jgi:lipid-A-disaccharide synthase